MMRRKKIATAGASFALAAGALVVATAPAQAAGDVPLLGELCRATENIQFYNGAGQASYVVQAGDSIRIDSHRDGYWVQGHGNGHSTRSFQWLHSNGVSRVTNCH